MLGQPFAAFTIPQSLFSSTDETSLYMDPEGLLANWKRYFEDSCQKRIPWTRCKIELNKATASGRVVL